VNKQAALVHTILLLETPGNKHMFTALTSKKRESEQGLREAFNRLGYNWCGVSKLCPRALCTYWEQQAQQKQITIGNDDDDGVRRSRPCAPHTANKKNILQQQSEQQEQYEMRLRQQHQQTEIQQQQQTPRLPATQQQQQQNQLSQMQTPLLPPAPPEPL
jgi:hypothetical protein